MGGKTEVGVRPQALRTLKEETVLVPALQRALKRSLLVFTAARYKAKFAFSLLHPALKYCLI